MQQKTKQFLLKHNMHFETICFQDACRVMIHQMEAGLAGEKSSLMMLPSYITVEKKTTRDGEIIVIDAGGSNLRIAVVDFKENGSAEISYFRKYPMPGTIKPVQIEDFFNLIAEYLAPISARSSRIGFCFSFPCEILPDKDGCILCFNKEVCVENAAGKKIGEGLNLALEKRGLPRKEIVVLNDTVATMLSGIAANNSELYDGFIGFILGTGTNACYMENTEVIKSVVQSGFVGQHMCVNMESGGYSGFLQGDFDQEVDSESLSPGEHIFEKMVSGAYLWRVIEKTILGGIRSGLFSSDFEKHFLCGVHLSLAEINEFSKNPQGDGSIATLVRECPHDRITLQELIEAIFERAAKTIAILFAAIMLHSGFGKDPAHPLCVTIEGTTYWKSELLQTKLQAYLDDIVGGYMGLHCEIVERGNSTILGSAIAAY